MTFHDHDARERHDRLIVAYQFDGSTPIIASLTCNGQTPQVVIDLGGSPLELELISDDPTALDGLITGLAKAREALLDHLTHHATGHGEHSPDTDHPLYVPDDWTTPGTGSSSTEGGDS